MPDNLPQIWEQFVTASNIGRDKRKPKALRRRMCLTTLKLSDRLEEHGYNTGERFDEWTKLITSVCTYLEGSQEFLEQTVREYFIRLYTEDQAEFSINFIEKTEGTSIGAICDIQCGGVNKRYYIKNHQRGPIPISLSPSNSMTDAHNPFIQELYVYELFALIKVGGLCHFPVPLTDTRKEIYIATEHIEFTLAKDLTKETASKKALVLIYFLQCALQLEDLLTNGGNFGQDENGDPIVADFWIVPHECYQLSDDMCRKFWKAEPQCNSKMIHDALTMVSLEERKEIVKQAVQQWELLKKMDEAKYNLEQFTVKNGGRLQVSGDLSRYACDVKFNVEKLVE